MDEFFTFINNHTNHFKKYNKIDDVDKITEKGWLYIFNAFCYDYDIDEILPENTDKFGKTLDIILQRLRTYKQHVRITNIEAIHCKFPDERERLVKAYLKYRTSIKPVAGHEYFTNCRNLIKVLMLIIVFIPDEEIVMYHKFYADKNQEYNILFNKIDEYIKKIKEEENFELKIVENTKEEKSEPVIYECEFCKKEYSNIHILNNHQKTANFCLKIQNNINSNEPDDKNNIQLSTCHFCNKEFNTKFKLSSHLKNCKHKELEEVKKYYETKIEELSVELEENKKDCEVKLEENKKDCEVKLEELKKNCKKEIEDVIKEYELKLELSKKEVDNIKKELRKEIQVKDDYIQTLKNQLNVYIEKTTSPVYTVNNIDNINNNNNHIVNTVNIKDQEFNKLFASIKPMIPRDIKTSMEQIRFQPMINNVEPMDKYFIKCFVEHFKDYVFTTDGSRGTIIIKLENGDSDKIKAVQFILDCFKIAEDKLRILFTALNDHLKHLSDIEEITLEQYGLYKVNLKDLVCFVLENKSNKLVNKIASELVKRSKMVKNKRLTDNKVIENEILKLG